MKMRKVILLFLLLYPFHKNSADILQELFSKALRFYNQKEYTNAYNIFEKFLLTENKDEVKKVYSTFYAADCLLNIKQFHAAAILFESLISENILSELREPAYYKLGEIYYQIGNYRKCREKLFTLTEAYPNTIYKGAAYYWIAESYLAEKRYLEAEEYFQKAIELKDKNEFIVNTLYSFGQLYENTNNYSKAVEYYDELLTFYKDSPIASLAQFRISISYFYLHEYDNAILELTDPLIKNLPEKNFVEAKYYLASSYMRLKDYQNAISIFNDLLKEKLSQDLKRKILYEIAWAKFQLNDYSAAYDIFSNLTEQDVDSLSIYAFYWSGECKRYEGDIKTAEDIYKKFLEKYPNHNLASKAQLSKATVYYSTNQSKQAEESLINPTLSGDQETKGRAFTLLGEIKLNSNNFAEARNNFTSALKFISNNVQLSNRAKLGLAISEFYLNNYSSASKYLEELFSRYNDFENDKVNFYLAEVYFAKKEYAAALKHYNNINSLNDKINRLTLLGKAYSYFNLKDFANAVYYFNDYINKYKNDRNIKELKLRLADSYYALKNFSKASIIYKELFSGDISFLDNDQAYYQYCQALYKSGNISEAIKEFSNLQRRFPYSKYSDAAQYVVGWIYFQQGDFYSAINNYLNLIKKFPNSDLIPVAYYSIGDSYYNLSNYDSAVVFYNKVLEEYPGTQYVIDAVNGIQYAFIAKGQPNDAINFIEQLVRQNPNLKFGDQIYFKKGDIYYSINNFTNAINSYQEFIQLYPRSELVHNAYFWIAKSYANIKKDNEAIQNFQKVLEFSRKSDIGISAAVELANIYSNKKQYSYAIDILNSIINVIPTSNRVPELLYLKGLAEVKDGNLKSAYSTFEQIIIYYEGNIFAAKSKVELGILELEKNNYENAINLLKETSENRTDDIGAQAQYYYGLALFNQNKIEDAITAFVRVRTIFSAYDEWYTKSLLKLGDCYVKLNDKKLAREMYRAVLIRHPKGEFATEAIKKLKQL